MIVRSPCFECGASLPASGIARQMLGIVDLVICARCGAGQRVDDRLSGATMSGTVGETPCLT